MADTTFVDGTVIEPDWLNDVNDGTYTKLANVTTISAAAATVLDDASTTAMKATLGAASSGAVTASGITMTTARVLGRTTASTGAIEELTLANLVSFLAGNTVPVGTIIDFAGTTAPTGYLACPTSATNISRTTYADLFAAIGTTWGSGDGSTTFGQPWFPADYTGVQASSNVGTATTGEVKAHTHTVNLTSEMASGANSGSLRSGSTTNTGSTGGSANLAAGHRVLKCVKI